MTSKVAKAMEKKRIPKRRFREFLEAGEWEEIPLGKVADVYDGVHQTPNYKDSGVMFLSVENIKDMTSTKYISYKDFEKNFSVYPEKGDVLMTRIGDIGTTNVVETDELLAYYVSLALIKPSGIESYYLSKAMLAPSFQKELWHRTLHIAFPKKINKNEIAKAKLCCPLNVGEQKKSATSAAASTRSFPFTSRNSPNSRT